jgi:hypothetical protein
MKLLNDFEVGDGEILIKDILIASLSLNFASCPANDAIDATGTLTGVSNGDTCLMTPPNSVTGSGRIFQGFAIGTNTVRGRFINTTESAIDLASATYNFLVIKTA